MYNYIHSDTELTVQRHFILKHLLFNISFFELAPSCLQLSVLNECSHWSSTKRCNATEEMKGEHKGVDSSDFVSLSHIVITADKIQYYYSPHPTQHIHLTSEDKSQIEYLCTISRNMHTVNIICNKCILTNT